MDCRVFENSISPYIDNELNEIDKKAFELHLLKCDECRESYESMIDILQLVRAEEEEELPEGYNETLSSKLRESRSNVTRLNWKVLSSIAASLVFLMVTYGLITNNFNFNTQNSEQLMTDADSSMARMKTADTDNYEYSGNESSSQPGEGLMAMDQAEDEVTDESKSMMIMESGEGLQESTPDILDKSDGNNNLIASRGLYSRKVVKEAILDIEIENYDEVYEEILNYITQNNGYIENSNKSYSILEEEGIDISITEGVIRIRIPEDKFNGTIEFLQGIGVIKNEQISEYDITEEYLDAESSVIRLRIQEDRLREILMETPNVHELLEIESDLRIITNEIEDKNNALENWNNSLMLPTINANLSEVEKEQEDNSNNE